MRLIDADALKYRRKEYGGYDDVGDVDRKRGILYLLEEDIAAAPTIEPKKGKWIVLRSDGRFGKETRCSQCGEIYWEWMSKFDYCPKCGAKMESEAEE